MFIVQGAEKVKAAQQDAEALKRETALAAAALEGRTQTLARQEATAAEAKALLVVRTKELDNREVQLTQAHYLSENAVTECLSKAVQICQVSDCLVPLASLQAALCQQCSS